MSTSKDMHNDHVSSSENYKIKDADDNNGIVPDDALQKVNPAAAERATADYDPHNVVKDHEQYDTSVTENKK
jgi:hypothetical protein